MVLIKHDEEYYRQRKPQPDLGAFHSFKRFLWDPERRAFLDRTAEEWVNVGIFYVCFYTVLFSFTTFQMWITYKSVACYDKPYFQYDRASSKAWLEPSRRNPSVNLHGPGIVLKPNVLTNGHSPRILIDASTEIGRPQKYVDAIDGILEEYRNKDKSKFDENCNGKSPREDDDEKPCFFDISTLGPCAKSPYGYTLDSPQPCAYVKFNKRFGWLPVFYSQGSVLPRDMPDWLQKIIIQQSDQFYVWLSCEGKSDEDKRRVGEIEYLPRPGFPVQFFPFNGKKNYLAPVVALRFKNLPVDQQVTVECKTWARNIDNENRMNLNFKIMIKK